MDAKIGITRLSSDPTVSHSLWLQLCALKDAITLDATSTQELFLNVLEVIKKLESVKYHRDNLSRIVSEELQGCRISKEGSAVAMIDRSTGAEKEFEALLLQAKATLDILVKVLKPIAGLTLQTYGEGGKRVVKSLQNNLPKPLLERADWLIDLVRAATGWVEGWVGPYRDTVAHYRSIESTGFITITDETGQLQFFPPRGRQGMPLTEVATSLFEDLVAFCEAFLVFAYRIRISERFVVRVAKEDDRRGEFQTKFVLSMAQ